MVRGKSGGHSKRSFGKRDPKVDLGIEKRVVEVFGDARSRRAGGTYKREPLILVDDFFDEGGDVFGFVFFAKVGDYLGFDAELAEVKGDAVPVLFAFFAGG